MEDKNVRFGIGVIVNIIVVIIAVVLIYFIGAKGFAFGAKYLMNSLLIPRMMQDR